MHRLHDTRARSRRQGVIDVRTIEGRRAIVFGLWDYLALMAYQAYKQHGRGALILAGDRNGADKPPYPYLVPDDNPDMDHDLAEMIDQYDPDREIVVVFALRGFANAGGCYQVEDDQQTPAAIYRRAN